MGIQGLLPLLKDIQHKVSLSSFHGQTVGIDAYCWLHKGAYGCAFDLVEGKDSNVYVNYVMKRINLLKSLNITPILVFDGGHLPAKGAKEEERRRNREEQLRKGKAFLRAGNKSHAIDCFQKCVNITPAMATKVIMACRKQKVLCIVAPYEADAQLAYLQKEGITSLTITEDSDLLIYGCTKVLFKMTSDGEGTLIDLADLNRVRSMSLASFTMEKFRHMCMLSGCDYLPSIRGMGLVKSYKVMRKSSDVYRAIKSIKLDHAFKVPDDYENNFRRADAVFRFQLVFDPRSQCVVRLNDVNEDDDVSASDLSYAGPNLPREVAIAIALGNKDPISGARLADFLDFDAEMPGKTMQRNTELPGTIQSDGFAFRTEKPLKQTAISHEGRKRDSIQHESEEPEVCLSHIYGKSEATDKTCDDGVPQGNESPAASPSALQRHFNPFKKNRLTCEDETEAQGVRSRYFPLGIRSGPESDQLSQSNFIENHTSVEKPAATSLLLCLEANSDCNNNISPHRCHEQRQALSPVDVNSSSSQFSQPDVGGEIHRRCGPVSPSPNPNDRAHVENAGKDSSKSCSGYAVSLSEIPLNKSAPQTPSLHLSTGRSAVQTHSPVFTNGKPRLGNLHIRDMLQRFVRKGSGVHKTNVNEDFGAENKSQAGWNIQSCQRSVRHMDRSNSQYMDSPDLNNGGTGGPNDSKENGVKVSTGLISMENVAEKTTGMLVATPGRCRPVGLSVKRKAGEPLSKGSEKKSTQTQITLQKFAFRRKTLPW